MAFGGMDPWRVVLLGKTGSGKSATGNTILGVNVFVSAPKLVSVTKTCSGRTARVESRSITVIDTPGLYDTGMSQDFIVQEIVNGVQMVAPGPHAFLLVIKLSRFTAEERNTVRNFQQIFGDAVHNHMIVLFTGGDDLEGTSIEEYLQSAPAELINLLAACGWRYHVFNNRQMNDRGQVRNLLQKIYKMLSYNNHSYYNYELFQMASTLNDVGTSDMVKQQTFAQLEATLRMLQRFNPSCNIL